MTGYQILMTANYMMINGNYQNINNETKVKISNILLSCKSEKRDVLKFHQGVNAPSDRRMYPDFFIPPYNNGKKLRLITGELPKTHILSANFYELEILRLLILFTNNHPDVINMVNSINERLETTCFANFCDVGECVGAGITALRFYMAQDKTVDKSKMLIEKLTNVFLNQTNKKHDFPTYYYLSALLCYNDEEYKKYVCFKQREYFLHLNKKNLLYNSKFDDINNLKFNKIRKKIISDIVSLISKEN